MRTFIVLFSALALPGEPAGASQPKVVSFRLDNGLKVLLRPVEGAGKIAVVSLFSLGERHDPEGRSGLAHLLEHVYITASAGATKSRTAREFMRRYPAGCNAQTGEDYTVIATVFAKDALKGELQEAAARMGQLRVTAADLDRQKRRVIAEVANMFGGIPALAARNLARERIRPSPPGGRRGGIAEQVTAIGLEEVTRRWKQYYKPANATVVLAGGFDVASARAMIGEYFGKLPAGQPAPARRACGAPRAGQIERTAVKSRVPNARAEVCLAYAAPPPESDLYAPFLVIVARMWRRAATAGAGLGLGGFRVQYGPVDDPAALFLSAAVGAKQTAKQTVARLEEFVSGAGGAEVRPLDILAAKNAFGWILGTANIPDRMLARNPYGLAFSVGRRAQLGIDAAKLAKAMVAVKTEDVHRAAKKVFARGNRAGMIVTLKRE